MSEIAEPCVLSPTRNEVLFEKLFCNDVFLPFNKRILLVKIQKYLETFDGNVEDMRPSMYFDVFIYENYEELVSWCEKTGRTIQYLD
jgi:hypothetical protein